MVRYQLIVSLFLLLYSLQVYSQIYRCTVNGKVVFTDQPCDGDRVKLSPSNTLPAVSAGEADATEAADGVGAKPYSSTRWYTDYAGYQTALGVGREYNVPVFLYFQADWCRFCRQLERELLNTREGTAALSKVVKVRITPENGDKENQLFRGLGGKGYPSVFIVRPPDSPPKKYYLMKKESHGWVTKSADYLEKVLTY